MRRIVAPSPARRPTSPRRVVELYGPREPPRTLRSRREQLADCPVQLRECLGVHARQGRTADAYQAARITGAFA
jgi:hypothetical protein